MGEGEFPPKGVPDGEAWREALRLYVAMTRGRDEVCLVYQGKPSPFITAMNDAVTQRPLSFAVVSQSSPRPEVETIAPESEAPRIEPPLVDVTQAPEAVPETGPSNGDVTVPRIEPDTVIPPEPDEMVLNGVTLLVIRGEPSVRSVAKALGRDLTQIHNDFMSHGVFTAPDAPVVRAFAYRVMEKYGCSPIFRNVGV